MDFSVSSLMCGFVFGVIGIAVFRRGKKMGEVRLLAAGFAMMVYPYFISNAVLDWLIGIILCVLTYFCWR